MSILVLVTSPFVEAQLAALRRLAPHETIHTDADAAPDDVEAILAFRMPTGLAERFPRLRFVAAAGAGVDELGIASIPAGVEITRVNDPAQLARMAQYVSLCVLRWHRDIARLEAQQRERRWERISTEPESAWTVGLMGFGMLGHAVARSLATFRYPLRAWTRAPHEDPGIESFSGNGALERFLAGTRVLVCLLPLTRETRGLGSSRVFAALPQGAYVVNVSRGAVLDEEALVAAVRSGHLAGAALDVFATEPLPPTSALWSVPSILVTPHVAAMPNPESAAKQLLDNLDRARRGEPLAHTIDRSLGY